VTYHSYVNQMNLYDTMLMSTTLSRSGYTGHVIYIHWVGWNTLCSIYGNTPQLQIRIYLAPNSLVDLRDELFAPIVEPLCNQ